MLCKNCENNIKSDFKYCPYCGERIISDFHDQFHDLTPPFVLHDLPEEDDAAAYYTAAPGETAPDFENLPRVSRFRQTEPENLSDLPELPPRLEQFEDNEDEDSPYFVYRPQQEEIAPAFGSTKKRPAAAPPSHSARPNPASAEPQGMGLGIKLLLILLILILAAAVTFSGYWILKPERATIPDASASFARML